MTATEHKSDLKLKTDTPYLALMGELWGVYYENFEEKWPCYNGTTLFIYTIISDKICKATNLMSSFSFIIWVDDKWLPGGCDKYKHGTDLTLSPADLT